MSSTVLRSKMPSDTPRIVSLPLTLSDAQRNLEQAKRDMAVMIEFQGLAAQLIKAKYDALRKLEFSHEDALRLCCNEGK